MDTSKPLTSTMHTALKVLLFRASRQELLSLGRSHLVFGLLCTWLVGMGRYWDDPGAHLLQHLGVGSVAYVFALSAILWACLRPIGAKDWSYLRVLTLVCLTSPPALLYAIPVERFMEMDAARSVNVWFLAAVATWRVALLIFFARRLGRLNAAATMVGCLLPLTLIITALTALNLERAVFDVMGGLHGSGTENDSAYGVLFLLTGASLVFFPLSLIGWLVMLFRHVHSDNG